LLNKLRNRREYFDEPNEYRILRLARDARQISRVEIANRIQLSKTTVSEITNRFVESGFLKPAGQGSSSARGGRKRELLDFNPDAAYVIGIDIERTRCDVAVTNLDATLIHRASVSYPAGTPPVEVLKQVVDLVHGFGKGHGDALKKTVGLGIGLPGVIDPVQGTIKVADTLKGWEGFDVSAFMTERFDLPVFVENDVKARTLGEMIFGHGRNISDAVYFWMGDGIGAGIVIGGRLHHGFTNSAGEIGYNELGQAAMLQAHFPLLFKEQSDIGDLLSKANILRAIEQLFPGNHATLDQFIAAVEQENPSAQKLLREISEMIGSLCINMINMLNPEVVLLGGELFWKCHQLVHLIQAKVSSDILPVPANAVKILPSSLKDDGVLFGSVGHVLFDLFRPTRGVREMAEQAT